MMELHQGSSLSFYLFNLVLDVFIKDIQKIIHNYIFFMGDIVLIGESRESIN